MGTFRINELFIEPAVTLIVVEAVESWTIKTATGGYTYGNIAPIAVVIGRGYKKTAYDMQAQPASVEQLRRDIPALDAALSI